MHTVGKLFEPKMRMHAGERYVIKLKRNVDKRRYLISRKMRQNGPRLE